MTGLAELEAAIERDLELLQYPRRPWLEPRSTRQGAPILDVLIVGGGQGGVVAAAALIREKVTNLLVVDDNPVDRAGPWLNFARMNTLRTPKYLTGPDLGIPNLTVQAWYEAQHGEGSWETMGLIPKEDWAAYLAWYRKVMGVPVLCERRVTALRWREEDRCFEAELSPTENGVPLEIKYARRVVLATGIEGSGDWFVPPFITEALPDTLYAHTRWDIDFEGLRGKRIGVLGAGASAFDNASVALERGAERVDLFFRRAKLVDVNPYRWAEFVGFLRHHADLPDADRWRFIHQIIAMGQLPPKDTLSRARAYEGFHLQPASPWRSVKADGDAVVVETPKGQHRFDFIIVGTGFRTDLSKRRELAGIHPHIALWSDRFEPPAEERHADLLRHPYLGPSFELTEKTPGEAPWLRHIYNYTFGCLVSLGFGGASISGMKYSLPRLVGGITGSLFVEDSDEHYARLRAFDEKEFALE